MGDFWKKVNAFFGSELEETAEEKIQKEARRQQRKMSCEIERRKLLDELQESLAQVMALVSEESRRAETQGATMESTDDKKSLLLNDDIAAVTALCSSIDRCCSHGLKAVEGEENCYVKFYGLLKWTCSRIQMINLHYPGAEDPTALDDAKSARVMATSAVPGASELGREIRGFVTAIRTVNSLSNVHLDEGRARAFIRQALNTHILLRVLQYVADPRNRDLLQTYYTEFALMREEECTADMIKMLTGLDGLNFAFLINDPRLDKPPETLPFSKPLPRLLPKRVQKPKLELIDPDDMVEGRVRLCEEDESVDLLAEKLVSHRHLGEKFDKKEGGNPLADLLKLKSASDMVGDAANAVMKFMELGSPEYEVFGSPLAKVVCNPFLCGLARFDPAMGVPDIAEACISYLHRKLSTPGLFQVHLSSEHIIDLRDAIEEIGGFHKQMAIDPHEVVSVLLQFLWELPDPLFTDERMESFLQCARTEDRDERKRSLSFLINDLPWTHKPLMEKLFHLLARALQPEFSQKSGVTVDHLASMLAPVVLRPKRMFHYNEFDDPSLRRFPVAGNGPIRERLRAEMARAHRGGYGYDADRLYSEVRSLRANQRQMEMGAKLVKAVLLDQAEIFADFRVELEKRRKLLELKVNRLELIPEDQSKSIDLSDAEHVSLLKQLWDLLLQPGESEADAELKEADYLAESQLALLINAATSLQDGQQPSPSDVGLILRSRRWKTSGWHTEDPMGGFRGGGLLSLKCMVYFLREYPEKAKQMMQRNAVPGGTRYPFPVAAINVMRMLSKLLLLDQNPSSPASRLLLHSEGGSSVILELRAAEAASRAPFWRLLDDSAAFEKLFCMAFMILDLHWVQSGATQMGFAPVLDSTRRQLGWLLERCPKTVDECWEDWMKVREKALSGGQLSAEVLKGKPKTLEPAAIDEDLLATVLQQRSQEELERDEKNQEEDLQAEDLTPVADKVSGGPLASDGSFIIDGTLRVAAASS